MTQEIYAGFLTTWDEHLRDQTFDYTEPLTGYFNLVIVHFVGDKQKFEPISELNHYLVIH